MEIRLPVDLELFRDPKLRLGLAPYVPDVEGVLNDYLFIDFERRLKKLPVYRFTVVEKDHDPALVAYRLYGTTDLWGALLLYNDMDIFDWVEGAIVKAFNIRDYEVMLSEMLVKTQTIISQSLAEQEASSG